MMFKMWTLSHYNTFYCYIHIHIYKLQKIIKTLSTRVFFFFKLFLWFVLVFKVFKVVVFNILATRIH